MVNPPRDPGTPPPRPDKFSASHTPGLPQATPDHEPRTVLRNGGSYDTPSAAIIASAGKRVVEKRDSRGRRLVIKFLTARDRMQIAKVIGGELAKNEVYLGYATLAWAVIELDDGTSEDPVLAPILTVRELEFLVERLGDEGLATVGRTYQEDFADLLTGADIDLAKK